MARKITAPESYSDEQDIKNIKKMREILSELPPFCRRYFRGIEDSTAPRTRLGYAYDLRVFFTFLHDSNSALSSLPMNKWGLEILEQLTREDLEEYLEYLSYYEKDGTVYTNDEKGKSRKLSALRSMFQYFYTSGLIEKDISRLVNMPKKHEKPIIRLSQEEVEELIELVEDGSELTRQELRYHDKTKVRDEALLILFLGTGIRVSELVGLDLQDINFRENAIRVHRKGDYDAIVYFGDEVSRALKSYLEERKMIIPKSGSENAFFLSLQKSRITVRAVEKLVQKYASRVTSLKKITPHKLRSTYGTNLYKASGDIYLVADVLGHKDVNTTRKHYAAMDEDRRKSAVNMVRLHGEPPADAQDPE